MMKLQNAVVAGACALAVSAAPATVQAAPAAKGQSNSVAGISMKDIQEVGRGGGGRGWGGGGRSFGGRGWGGGQRFSGRRGWGGRSWAGHRGWGGRSWRGGGRYYNRRGYGWGWWPAYAAAGVVAGAAIASPYYYDDGDYDDGYYEPRRAYRGSECQVITKRRDVEGRPVRVVRYRPC